MYLISSNIYEIARFFPQESACCVTLLALMLLVSSGALSGTRVRLILLLLTSACALASAFPEPAVHHLVVSNSAVSACKLIVSLAFALTLLVDACCSGTGPSALLLLGFGFFSSMALLSSNDWFFLFLCVELLTLTSYCLIGLARTRRALEAVLKYFAAGALSACLLLFGILILFVSTEGTSFFLLPAAQEPAFSFTLLAMSALLTKLGAAPFHYWVADAYEGAPAIVTVTLAVAVKLCVFLLLCRVSFGPLLEAAALWKPIMVVCSAASITVGCLGALFQKRVKRLLAYSSINNAGYGLAGLAAVSVSGLQASLAYMCFYSASALLLFGLVLGPRGEPALTYVSELRRLRHSRAAVLAALVLFSMAGIPPLTGFWIKFFVLSELVRTKMYALAALAALVSVLSSFYYVNLIKILYFEDGPVFPAVSPVPLALPVPLAGLLLATLFAYAAAPGAVLGLFGRLSLSFLTGFL